MPTDYSMPPEVEKKLYLDGIHLFNEREFFEAHEVWEDAWHMAYGVKHSFYQGMIQCAVALEHYRRWNPPGGGSLFKSYQTKVKGVPERFMGLEVKTFLERMKEVLKPVVEAEPLPQSGEIGLDESKAPQIRLLYDPFETGEAQRFSRPNKF